MIFCAKDPFQFIPNL